MWSELWAGIVEVREPPPRPLYPEWTSPLHLGRVLLPLPHCPPWRKEEVAFTIHPSSQSLVNVINFAKEKLPKVMLYL